MSSSDAESSYREFVKRYAKADQLSQDEYAALESYRSRLRLLPAKARAIEQEILKPQAGNSAPESAQLRNTTVAEAPQAPVIHQPDPIPETPAFISSDPNANDRFNTYDRPVDPTAENPIGFQNRAQSISSPTSVATTVLPPPLPDDYFAHLEHYGQEFLQALRLEGFNLTEDTRERLRKLAKQYDLVGSDVADIERKMLVELYLTSKPIEASVPSAPPPPPPPVTQEVEVVPEIKYDLQLTPLFEELEGSLKAGRKHDLQSADAATFELLLKIIQPPQPWLDEESLKKFVPKSHDKKAIQEIDRLWNEYSQERFGFSRQLQLYGFVPTHLAELNKQPDENRRQALAFSKQAKWWINGLEFFKYYNQLDFTTDAPAGHLPAWWFWTIPRSKVFQYGGLGLLEERGGCGIDAFILPAFMFFLKNCGIEALPTIASLQEMH